MSLFQEVPTYTLALRPGPMLLVAERACKNSIVVERIARAWFREHMPAAEHVLLIGLNGKNDVCGLVEIGRGGAHGCALTPLDVLRTAIALGASAFVLSHNHPSGDPEPSDSDLVMTRAVAEAANVIGIKLLDHVVIGTPNGGAVSIFEHLENQGSPIR